MDYNISLYYKNSNGQITPFTGANLYLRSKANGYLSNDISGLEHPADSGNYIFSVDTTDDYRLWDQTAQSFIESFSNSGDGKTIMVSDAFASIQNQLNEKLDKSGGSLSGSIDMLGNPIHNLPAPLAPSDPATKSSVETALNNKLDKSGGSLSGTLFLTNGATITGIPDPQDDFEAVSKSYLESQLIDLSAVDTKTPDQTITVRKIFNVLPFISGTPSSSLHPVNKSFLDSQFNFYIPFGVLNCRPRFKDGNCSMLILQNSTSQAVSFSKIPMTTGIFKLYSTSPIFTLAQNGTSYISVFCNSLFLQEPYASIYHFKIYHYSAYEIRLYVYNSSGQLTDDSFDYLSMLIHIYPDASV